MEKQEDLQGRIDIEITINEKKEIAGQYIIAYVGTQKPVNTGAPVFNFPAEHTINWSLPSYKEKIEDIFHTWVGPSVRKLLLG